MAPGPGRKPTITTRTPHPTFACHRRGNERAAAFSLVEVTVALGLAAFGLLTIFGLLPSGVTSSSDSVNTTVAGQLATAIVSDLRVAPRNGSSPIYNLQADTPSPAEGSRLFLTADGRTNGTGVEAKYVATVFVVPPPASSSQPTQVRVVVSWPTAKTNNPPSFFEAVTALDRS